jgi:ABC-type lipoprotein export system ATPase subunit
LPIIEIMNLAMAPPGTPRQYATDRLVVAHGDMVAIVSDSPIDGRHLLRVLATLARPGQGTYRFNGEMVNLKDYRQCLAVKRQIGYVAADAAMISNRTIRENLLLTRFYYENDLSIDIDKKTEVLCRDAGLFQKLEQRPSVLNDSELLTAIAIREMGKAPAVMLVDRPERFLEIADADGVFIHLKKYGACRSRGGLFFSSHQDDRPCEPPADDG